MKRKFLPLFMTLSMLITLLPSTLQVGAATETKIFLSDTGITVDGSAASTSSSSYVYTGADIIYYEEGHDSSYGEGTAADAHSAAEAAAHTVVTITEAGTYRISGTLSKGQIAVDLGSSAATDPSAVVTLILDDVNITSTVAPAIIFYNVYECGVVDEATATGTVDTTGAGANVVLADGSVNYVNGSYVARIYKSGTTKKLHKYDGAFYSKMSMNVSAESAGTGKLYITAENEGLDSELHLTINSGNIFIESQDDAINTNEDNVSVTTINGGYLYINGGLGSEGDGIDSNGYLVINGGTIITLANGRTGDGGIDADKDILLNGGTVIALGSRNDTASSSSSQPYMELTFASTKAAGTLIRIVDSNGSELLTFSPLKEYQSFTYTSPSLKLNETYQVYSGGSVSGVSATNGLYTKGGVYTGGTLQQYTGNATGMMPGMGGGQPPQGGAPGGNIAPGSNLTSGAIGFPGGNLTPGAIGLPGANSTPGAIGFPGGNSTPGAIGLPGGQPPSDGTLPSQNGGQGGPADGGSQTAETEQGSVDFVLTQQIKSFSGVSDSADASEKTRVTFSVNNGSGMTDVQEGQAPALSGITVKDLTGSTASVPTSDIQLTITDVPSENYSKTCMLSDGAEAIAALLPSEAGTYQLTLSVVSSNENYTGTSQWQFTIGSLPFTDVSTNSKYYNAIQYVYENGLIVGTSTSLFSPDMTVSRGMTVAILGRLASAEKSETSNYTDILSGSWYSSYIGWAVNKALISGYGNGKFGPDDAVTREQISLIIYNYAKAYGIELKTGTLSYTDTASISSWAKEAAAALRATGLLEGITEGNAFKAASPLTRAEFADILYRLSQLNQ